MSLSQFFPLFCLCEYFCYQLQKCKFNFLRTDLGKSLRKARDIFLKGFYACCKIVFQIIGTTCPLVRRKQEYLFQSSFAKNV